MSFYITKLRSDRSPVIDRQFISDQSVNGHRSVKSLCGWFQGLHASFPGGGDCYTFFPGGGECYTSFPGGGERHINLLLLIHLSIYPSGYG